MANKILSRSEGHLTVKFCDLVLAENRAQNEVVKKILWIARQSVGLTRKAFSQFLR